MHIILGVLAGLIGLSVDGVFGLLLGAVVGILIAEVLAQRKRIAALEQRSFPSSLSDAAAKVVFTPAPDEDQPLEAARQPQGQQKRADSAGQGDREGATASLHPLAGGQDISGDTPLDRFFTGLGDRVSGIGALFTRFFTSGNLVLKIGVIILFFGLAFLLKYAAQRNLVPLEFRLAGVAGLGLALLALGWRLRRRTLGYGLILQGGGVGVLYLVVYAAAKLYHFLPLTFSLAIMISLVVLSSLLAVLQEARSLAVAGIVGGFLAPVLMSTGAGSHVLLFSYYGLLNIGILGIAWFKSWRELNLLGFVFTFAIATVWGYTAYRPENFATTEPFLIFFFLLYVAVSVLFARRQPLELRGFVDGPLVFGLPLVVASLQYCLVRDFDYGMAVSALVLGLFYILLAALLWRRLAEGLRLLTEAFLALAAVFGSLAIPLAFDGQWSSAAWAMEGAGMIWIGVRQGRVLARFFALLLQFGAAIMFLDGSWYPFGAPAFLNRFFLGCLLISMAALFSSCYLDRFRSKLRGWERYLPLPLMVWGLLWWYLGGLREIDRNYLPEEFASVLLLFCSASTMLMTMFARKVSWRQMLVAQLIFLPAMIISVFFGLQSLGYDSHLFAGWGKAAWPIALFTGYRLLYLVEEEWPRRLAEIWHAATLWLLLFLISHEGAWLVRRIAGLGEIWPLICWGLIPAAAIFSLSRSGQSLFMRHWPFGKFNLAYCGIGCSVPAIWLFVWNLFCLSLPGNPAPLSYLPLFNPLELSQLLTLAVLFSWGQTAARAEWRVPAAISRSTLCWFFGGLSFLVLNSIMARTVHVFADVPYTIWDLYHSLVFQASLAALWGISALVITVWSARNGNRRIWCVGAALLVLVVIKLFVIDLSGTGTIARIVSFLVVGGLMLIIGYFSPLPPPKEEGEKCDI
jgi:uncharacterized membrane protein